MKRLAGVIVLMVFVLSVFALMAMRLFMGSLRQKCVIMPSRNETLGIGLSVDYYDDGHVVFDYSKYMNSEGKLVLMIFSNRDFS